MTCLPAAFCAGSLSVHCYPSFPCLPPPTYLPCNTALCWHVAHGSMCLPTFTCHPSFYLPMYACPIHTPSSLPFLSPPSHCVLVWEFGRVWQWWCLPFYLPTHTQGLCLACAAAGDCPATTTTSSLPSLPLYFLPFLFPFLPISSLLPMVWTSGSAGADMGRDRVLASNACLLFSSSVWWHGHVACCCCCWCHALLFTFQHTHAGARPVNHCCPAVCTAKLQFGSCVLRRAAVLLCLYGIAAAPITGRHYLPLRLSLPCGFFFSTASVYFGWLCGWAGRRHLELAISSWEEGPSEHFSSCSNYALAFF